MGVLQGSVLGPALLNILYDVVLGLKLTEPAKCIAFTDDLTVVVTERNMVELVSDVNES